MMFDTYLHALRRWLGDGERAARILEEIEGHLLDDAASLEASGLAPSEAASKAIRRFGSPARVALDFYARTPLVLVERLEPFLLFASTLVTLLFCGATVFFTGRAMIVEGVTIWSFVQLATAGTFAWIILLVWAGLGFRSVPLARGARAVGPWVTGAGCVGMALATWYGLTSGDWEYYLYVMNGNVTLMGVLMLRCFAQRARC